MKKIVKTAIEWLSFLAIFLIIYFTVNWYRMPELPDNVSLQMTDYQGTSIDLQSMSEASPVLIYFWGSWCGVCQISTPKVSQMSHAGYSVVTMAVQSGNQAELSTYMQEHDLSFTTISDPTGELFDSWQGMVTPSFVILNDGKITQGVTGVQPLWSLKLRMWISGL